MNQILQTWERPATPEQTYRVEVKLPSGSTPSPHTVAMLEWLETSGTTPREKFYLDRTEAGWAGCHVAPSGRTIMRVVLTHFAQLSASPPAQANFSCEEVPVTPPRRLKVGVAFQRAAEPATIEANMQVLIDTVREAGRLKLDLLCMTENLPDRNVKAPLSERAWPLDDARLQPLFDAVRESRVWTVFTMHEKRGEQSLNTAVLLSPQGEIVGTYSKRQLTFSELEGGLTPGDNYPVFDTPLGKIGILICWDAWFPESATALAKQGAEIICMPLAGDLWDRHWDHVWRTRAMDNQVFWLTSVTANCAGNAPSRVVSPSGEVLAETRDINGIVAAEIVLPHHEPAYWLSIGPCHSSVRNVFDHSRLGATC